VPIAAYALIPCPVCGTLMPAKSKHSGHDRKTCSPACKARRQSERMRKRGQESANIRTGQMVQHRGAERQPIVPDGRPLCSDRKHLWVEVLGYGERRPQWSEFRCEKCGARTRFANWGEWER